MTSSDDSSVSSADSILNSPVIKKRDGRAKLAEKRKMDFLDECLNGTNARADVQRRIAEVEREQKILIKHEDSGEKEGPGSDEEAVERVGNGIGHVTIKSEGGSMKVEAETTNDEANKQISDKENANNQVGQTKTQVKIESEDSYWARVDQFERQTSTTKASSANRTSQKSLANTRKRLNDAMAGLEYDSDTDDEDVQWKNGNGLTREQRRGEAAAKLTGGQSSLGLRRVFQKRDQRTRAEKSGGTAFDGTLRFYIFESRDEALDDLVLVVGKLNEMYRNSQSASEKLLHRQFVLPLSRLIKSSKQNIWGRGMNSLSYFLNFNPVMSSSLAINCNCNPNCALVVPDLFIQWLWKVSCSSLELSAVEAQFCHFLVKFLRKEPTVNEKCEMGNYCDCDIDVKSLKMFHAGALSKCLVDDFGLFLGPGSIGLPTDAKNNSSLVETSAEANESSDFDFYSLRKLFTLWSTLAERDFVLLDDAKSENWVVGEGATRDLVALARVSLDPHFELATQRYTYCGESPQDMIQRTISSIVNSTTRQIVYKCDRKHVENWLENTANAIVESCSTFGAGEEDAADNDDKNGHLPLATVVSNVLSRDVNQFETVSYECARLKLYLGEKALKVCLCDIDNWEDEIKAIMDARCESWICDDNTDNMNLRSLSDHAFRALITSEIAFKWIDNEKEVLLQDLPFFLAAVHIVGECVMAGAHMFCRTASPHNANDAKSDSFVSYTIEEKDVIYETLSSIEDLCDSVKAECGRRSVISFPHLRRAKEHLTRMSKYIGAVKGKYIGAVKGKSSKEKRQKRRAQGSLDVFFRSSLDQDEFSPSPFE